VELHYLSTKTENSSEALCSQSTWQSGDILKPQLQGITRANQNQCLQVTETTDRFSGNGIPFNLKLLFTGPCWQALLLCFALLKFPKSLFTVPLGRCVSDWTADTWQGHC